LPFSIRDERSISWQWNSSHYLGISPQISEENFIEMDPFSILIGNASKL
jgi:hypothetical protein